MRRRNSYRGDPKWITARYAGDCYRCGDPVPKGSRAFYWPRNRVIACETCGEDDYRRFIAEAEDEYMLGGGR